MKNCQALHITNAAPLGVSVVAPPLVVRWAPALPALAPDGVLHLPGAGSGSDEPHPTGLNPTRATIFEAYERTAASTRWVVYG
jgi:hypothetical protein